MSYRSLLFLGSKGVIRVFPSWDLFVLEILIGLYEDKTLNNFGFKRSKIKVLGVTNAKIAFGSSDKCEQWGDMHFFLKSIF